MPYEHLNRSERRTMIAYAREEAAKRPSQLTELPRDQWPPDYRDGPAAAMRVWQSRKYLAQLFDATAQMVPTTMLRLSVCRTTLKNDGRWEEGLEWEELMQIKRDVGYGDWVCRRGLSS